MWRYRIQTLDWRHTCPFTNRRATAGSRKNWHTIEAPTWKKREKWPFSCLRPLPLVPVAALYTLLDKLPASLNRFLGAESIYTCSLSTHGSYPVCKTLL